MVANTQMKKRGKDRSKVWNIAFVVFFLVAVAVMCIVTAHADIISDVNKIATDIYQDVVKISTPIAVASVSIALLTSYFSHNPKTVEVTRGAAKGVVITWVVILILGALFTYGYKLVSKVSGGTTLPTVTTGGGSGSNSNQTNP